MIIIIIIGKEEGIRALHAANVLGRFFFLSVHFITFPLPATKLDVSSSSIAYTYTHGIRVKPRASRSLCHAGFSTRQESEDFYKLSLSWIRCICSSFPPGFHGFFFSLSGRSHHADIPVLSSSNSTQYTLHVHNHQLITGGKYLSRGTICLVVVNFRLHIFYLLNIYP